MARRRFAVCFALAIVSATSSTAAAQVAYVNTDLILRQTPGYGTADSILTSVRTAYQQEADSLRAHLDSAMTAFDQQRLVLSEQAQQERLDALRALNDRVQARLQDMQDRILDRQRELVAPLEQRIQTVVDGVRAERNLVFIFDAANPNSAIISADPSRDLTALVVTRLQSAGQ